MALSKDSSDWIVSLRNFAIDAFAINSASFVESSTSPASSKFTSAHAYLVWRDTMSPSASEEAYKWLVDQVRQRNDEIRAHNEDEENLRKRAEAYKKGKLHELNRDDLALQVSKNLAEMDLISKERDRLTKCGDFASKDWDARKKTLIEAREGSSQFTVITKFVFHFHYPADSSVSSRYAQVLDWVHSRFADKAVNDVSEIVEEIQSAGGFERALHEQRGKPVTKVKIADDLDGSERKAMSEYATGKIKEALKSAPVRATIDIAAQYERDGLVVLVGRPNDSQIEIVEELRVDDKVRREVIAAYDDNRTLPTQPASEFISRVLSLGQLISTDEETDKTEFDLKAGQPVKIERTLSLLPCAKAGFEIVVSALHADACVVVKAVPHTEHVNLGKVNSPVMLRGEKTALLSKMLGNLQDRRLFQFSGEAKGASVVWTAVNTALDPFKNASKACRKFNWVDLAGQVEMPLNVVGFNPSLCRVCSMDEIKAHYKEKYISEEAGAKGKKKTEKVDAAFHGVPVARTANGDLDLDKLRAAQPKQRVSLSFRLADIKAFFQALTQQKATEFVLSADPGGLLCAQFTDDLATYEVFLPTVSADGKRLQNRRIEPMRFDTPLDDEAEVLAA